MLRQFKIWWFTRRWEKHYADWKPTRQRRKAFQRDLAAYLERGVWPW